MATLPWPPKKVTSILLDSGMEFLALNPTIAKDKQRGRDSPAEPPCKSQPGRSLHCSLGDPEPSLNSRPSESEYASMLFETTEFVRQKKKPYRSWTDGRGQMTYSVQDGVYGCDTSMNLTCGYPESALSCLDYPLTRTFPQCKTRKRTGEISQFIIFMEARGSKFDV